MAFEFRLQKLLDYREDQKKMAEEELARRQRELLAVQQELARLRGEEQRLLENYRRCQQKELDIFTLITLENYRSYLQENCRRETEKLRREEQNVSEQREVLLEAWRSCQVLSKLRDKAEEDYREEAKICEQRLNDELGLSCFMRQERN